MSQGRAKTVALCALVSGISAMLLVFLFSSLAGKKAMEVAVFSTWAYLIMCLLGMLLCSYVLSLVPVRENPSVMDEPPAQVDFIQMPEMPPLPTPAQDLAKPESELKAPVGDVAAAGANALTPGSPGGTGT
jgi:hypothetical protein